MRIKPNFKRTDYYMTDTSNTSELWELIDSLDADTLIYIFDRMQGSKKRRYLAGIEGSILTKATNAN